MARVTTKMGDEGFTDLLGPGRVPKYHRRPEAFGTVDEATSALGIARAHSGGQSREWILHIQRDLYVLMAELATTPDQYSKVDFKIKHEHVDWLDNLSEELKQQVEIGRDFIMPGETAVGAYLDFARTVVRRAERRVAHLFHDGDVQNLFALQYLNRLSDLLFVLARFEERSVT